MSWKYFIILFALFFLIMYVEKTHGCHPSGQGCRNYCAASITNVKWYPGILQITVNTSYPDSRIPIAPQAFGHFTFHSDDGHSGRILGEPQFVNYQHCSDVTGCQVNPYTSNWTFDARETPQNGVWYDIWIAVYWFCNWQPFGVLRIIYIIEI
ncbi:hypothetical protein C2G38_2094705 [Gigaspora rosea]|uniref:Reelin domain-containing protein n=1 Tax=Gigaspora rosea TaxID=44941 RepID=A0A397V088_9GLOM|nr:hypothetical protein C2G38_2094705 [Gigaspora rosea]